MKSLVIASAAALLLGTTALAAEPAKTTHVTTSTETAATTHAPKHKGKVHHTKTVKTETKTEATPEVK